MKAKYVYVFVSLVIVCAVAVTIFVPARKGHLKIEFEEELPSEVNISEVGVWKEFSKNNSIFIEPLPYGHYLIDIKFKKSNFSFKLCHQNHWQKENIVVFKDNDEILITHNYTNNGNPIKISGNYDPVKKIFVKSVVLGICG